MFNYDKLKTAIEASGKSKTYLCKKLDRPVYYLRDVIRQKNIIPDDYQKILAAELGVTVEYLNDENEKSPPLQKEAGLEGVSQLTPENYIAAQKYIDWLLAEQQKT